MSPLGPFVVFVAREMGIPMSQLLLLTNAMAPSGEVLPALGLLLHQVRVAPAEGSALLVLAVP